ncbi:hypothetical protein FRC02_002552 [Tulasnella sp. 418]|nr:hypothetical protein FRC02_002552 [Tulasnella sp. 418]
MLHKKANLIALLCVATASVIPAGSKPVIDVDKSSYALLPLGFDDNGNSCPSPQSLLPLELDANIINRIREKVLQEPSGTHEFESAPFPENKVLDMETLGKGGSGKYRYARALRNSLLTSYGLRMCVWSQARRPNSGCREGVLNGNNSVLESFLNETEALKMIKAYYGSYIYLNHDKNNRGLLLMRYEHGVPLIETKGYKETISPSGEFLMYDEDQDSQGHKLMFLRNVVEDIMKARK